MLKILTIYYFCYYFFCKKLKNTIFKHSNKISLQYVVSERKLYILDTDLLREIASLSSLIAQIKITLLF